MERKKYVSSIGKLAAHFLLVSVFFSSRGRHTSFGCDWSSEVCSSDLMRRSRSGKGWLAALERLRTNRHVLRCAPACWRLASTDRKSVVKGKSVDLGGRRIIKKKKK